MAVIYKIEHKETKRIYIGKAINAERRWKEHLYNVRTNKNHPLYNAIRKYGLDLFTFEILEEISEYNINQREIELINKYNTIYPNGYNLAQGGTGGNTRIGMTDQQKFDYNLKISKKTKEKVSQGIGISAKSIKGKRIIDICPEIADKWKANHKAGMKRVSERRKQGNFTQKELLSYEKLSISHLGGNNPRAAKIECIETGQVFGSMSEAVLFYKLNSRTPIQTTIKTQKPSTTDNIRGLTFKYYNK